MCGLCVSWKTGWHQPGKRSHTPHVTPWGWCYLLVLASVELLELCWLWKGFLQGVFSLFGLAHKTLNPRFELKKLDHRISLYQFLTANIPGGYTTICHGRCLLQRVRSCCQQKLKVGRKILIQWKWQFFFYFLQLFPVFTRKTFPDSTGFPFFHWIITSPFCPLSSPNPRFLNSAFLHHGSVTIDTKWLRLFPKEMLQSALSSEMSEILFHITLGNRDFSVFPSLVEHQQIFSMLQDGVKIPSENNT